MFSRDILYSGFYFKSYTWSQLGYVRITYMWHKVQYLNLYSGKITEHRDVSFKERLGKYEAILMSVLSEIYNIWLKRFDFVNRPAKSIYSQCHNVLSLLMSQMRRVRSMRCYKLYNPRRGNKWHYVTVCLDANMCSLWLNLKQTLFLNVSCEK